MSLMLDALRRIESKTDRAPVRRTHGYREERSVRALPAKEPTKDRAGRLGQPWPRAADRAYAELAKTVAGHCAKKPEAAILFTSPGDGEGKTSTVIGLAEALACSASPEKVLAVDGNLRRPGLTDRVDVDTHCGLLDVLSGKLSWRHAIRRAPVDGVSVLPGRVERSMDEGPVDNNGLRELLKELRQEFRYVLFDGPSLRYPETAEICRHFDGVYLVLALHRTSRNEAGQAVRIIDDCEGRLLGSVLTNDLK